jgi:gliding-associated putative ABC transporter substrate-binding component GldG
MKRKRSDILQLSLSLGIVLISAFLLSFYFFKLDLTEEKRHSLTPATQEMLSNLPDPLFIRCYLHGEFPAEFKRLENSIKERLDEFVDYSNGQIDYEFIDPYESGDEKIIKETEKALDEKGLRFTNISFNEKGAQSSKLIWPAAIVEYQGREYPIQFLKAENLFNAEQMVNTSVNNLEYELANGLRKITRTKRPEIAILNGHGEISNIQLADFTYGLSENYKVNPSLILNEKMNQISDKVDGMSRRINKYDALVIVGPDSVFSDKDKFIIDQFIMNGGKVLWMIDAMKINMDSLRNPSGTMALSNEHDLYEMLFEYGVRLNRSIMIDFQGAPINLDNGPMGNQRAIVNRTNYYAPVVFSSQNSHPIAANLDPIKLEFAGSLDSVNSNSSVIKKILLRSSALSKELKAPVRINLDLLTRGPEYFQNGNNSEKVLAMILEGTFKSAFKDQIPDTIRNNSAIAYAEKSVPTKMIVIGDGDIAKNKFGKRDGKLAPLALGYDPDCDPYNLCYDNKEFLMNCMNYLLDDQALISVRSRTIELRKMAEEKIISSGSVIKAINMVVPIALVIILGIIQFIWRKKRWTSKLI